MSSAETHNFLTAVRRDDIRTVQEVCSELNETQLSDLLDRKIDKDDNTVFHEAARKGSARVLKHLLELSPGDVVNVVNKKGWTPLHSAALEGKLDSIKCLCSRPGIINVNFQDTSPNYSGDTALHCAAFEGHLACIRFLVEEAGAKITIKKTRGSSVLHSAAWGGKLDCVEYLSEKAPELLNSPSNDGRIPLHQAAYKGSTDCVKYFREHTKADMNKQDERGDTPLHKAVDQNKHETVKYMCDECKIYITNKANEDPLDLAVRKGFDAVIWPIVYATPEHEVKFEKDYGDGNTLLHKAVTMENYEAVKYLCFLRGCKSIKNNEGATPFDLAVRSNSCPQSFLLLLYRVTEIKDFNRQFKGGKSLLHIAVESKEVESKETLQELCNMPGIRNIKDDNGKTPYRLAAESDDAEQQSFIAYLYTLPGADIADVNRKFVKGKTLLHFAVEDNREHKVKDLLEVYSSSIDVNVKDDEGYAPLHRAALDGRSNLLELICSNKSVNLNALGGPDDKTALSIAIEPERDYKEIIIYLLSQPKIDITFETAKGERVFHVLRDMIAREKGQFTSDSDDRRTTREDFLNTFLNVQTTIAIGKTLPTMMKDILEQDKPAALLDYTANIKKNPSASLSNLQTICAALNNVIVIGLEKYSAHEVLRYIFFKPSIYETLIKVFLDKPADADPTEMMAMLKLIFMSLQANNECKTPEKQFLKGKLDKEDYKKFETKLSQLSSSDNKSKLNDIQLMATKIQKVYFGDDSGIFSDIKKFFVDLEERVAKWTKFSNFFHKCSVRRQCAFFPCFLGIAIYISDVASDLLVGLDSLTGFSERLGWLILILTGVTLCHENARSVEASYEAEKELLRVKLGKYDLKEEDWLNHSDMNYGRNWLVRVVWPFRVSKDRTTKDNLKALLFNLLSFLMMRPVVDRMLVLLHSPTKLRIVYRQESKQKSLNQYFVIMEQLPELLIQFYLFQIYFNNIDDPDQRPEKRCFAYDAPFLKNCTKTFLGVQMCVSWMRIISMAIPFFKVPNTIVGLEGLFRKLDPYTPKMTSVASFLLYLTYIMMIPSRLFLFAGMMHAAPDQLIITLYLFGTAGLWCIYNVASVKKAAKKETLKDDEPKNSLKCGKYWSLLLFSFRDVFAVSLRDPVAYISPPSEVSHHSLRSWRKLILISTFHYVEGLFAAFFIEKYYPCGKIKSDIFKYQGWLWLLLYIISTSFLIILSYALQPQMKNILPKKFVRKSAAAVRFGLAMLLFAALTYQVGSFTIKIVLVSLLAAFLLLCGLVILCVKQFGEAKVKMSPKKEESPKKSSSRSSCFPRCCRREKSISYEAVDIDGQNGEPLELEERPASENAV